MMRRLIRLVSALIFTVVVVLVFVLVLGVQGTQTKA